MNAVMDIAFKANILSLRKHWGAFTVGYIPDQGVVCMIVKGTIFPMISQDFEVYAWARTNLKIWGFSTHRPTLH
jgi:hypothetical protein